MLIRAIHNMRKKHDYRRKSHEDETSRIVCSHRIAFRRRMRKQSRRWGGGITEVSESTESKADRLAREQAEKEEAEAAAAAEASRLAEEERLAAEEAARMEEEQRLAEEEAARQAAEQQAADDITFFYDKEYMLSRVTQLAEEIGYDHVEGEEGAEELGGKTGEYYIWIDPPKNTESIDWLVVKYRPDENDWICSIRYINEQYSVESVVVNSVGEIFEYMVSHVDF